MHDGRSDVTRGSDADDIVARLMRNTPPRTRQCGIYVEQCGVRKIYKIQNCEYVTSGLGKTYSL